MTRPPLRFPYCRCLCVLLLAWLIGAIVCVTFAGHFADRFAGIASETPGLVQTITIGSGLIALAAGLPGAVGELTQRGEIPPGQVTVGFSVGSLIRLFGTVALVGFCRYQMPAATLDAVALILVWYCYLTIVDVVVLAKLLPMTDRKPVDEGADAANDHSGNSAADGNLNTPEPHASKLAPSAVPR